MQRLVFAAATVFGLSSVAAAGAYDGAWIGQAKSSSCGTRDITMTVTGNSVLGTAGGGPLRGTIDASGNGTLLAAKGGHAFTVSFSGDKFELHGEGTCGHIDAFGQRSK